MKDRIEIQMEGKNIVYPIMENEKIAFFILVDKVNLNIFNFIEQVNHFFLLFLSKIQKKCSRLWFYISHILKTLKERQLFWSLLEQDESKLIMMFNYEKNLIFQSREIPSKLKLVI